MRGVLGRVEGLAGVMAMITDTIGAVTPPVAITVFVVRTVTRGPSSVIDRCVHPFLLSLAAEGLLPSVLLP